MAEPETNESLAELRKQARRAEAVGNGRPGTRPGPPIAARPVRNYRALVFQLYAVLATVGFGVLFFLARRSSYFGFDVIVERGVQSVHSFWLDVVMHSVSALGVNPLAGIFCGLSILFVFLVGLRWESAMLVVAALGVRLLELVVKFSVQRHRPTPDLVQVFQKLNDYSFPSGHVLFFTGFLGFLMFLVFTLTPRSWVRTVGLCGLGILIALVGVSRVYLGEHWPSDVLGAYLLGSLWLALMVYLYRKGKPRFFVRQPLAPGKPARRA